MKKKYLLICMVLMNLNIAAQNVGIGTNTPDTSALLDIKSNNKGLLVPRMTTDEREAIITPATGLLVYDTDSNSFWFYNSSVWSNLSASVTLGWLLTGNSGTNPNTDFIGTTDDLPLRFRLNNNWAGEMHPAYDNIFLGLRAGQANTTAGKNVAIGSGALETQSFDYGGETSNVAIGFEALSLNNPIGPGYGTSNTAVGTYALRNNTTGYDNTSIGASSLYSNNTGIENTAIGRQALFSNTSGTYNTAIGHKALRFNTTAYSNTALGAFSLQSNTIGSNNTANGDRALYSNVTGDHNTAIGTSTLYLNISGNLNTALGKDALYSNVAGSNATAIGYGAMGNSNNTATPFTSFNVAVGYEALRGSFSPVNNTGNFNTAIGYQSLLNNSAGAGNTANGANALYSNTLGIYNVAMGLDALYSNTFGSSNSAYGTSALYYNGIGHHNVAIGTDALLINTSGNNNTAIGASALSNNVGGVGNTAVGYNADTDLSSSTNNTLVGASAHCSASNSVVIGYNSFTNTNNLALLGNPSTLFTGGYTGWTNFSDGRFKKEIDENVRGLDFIMRLRSVTYHMDVRGLYNFWGISPYGKEDSILSAKSRSLIDDAITKKEAIRMTGFVAQEVEKAARESNYDFDGVMRPTHDKDHYRIAYGEFVVPLVKAMQEQQSIIETLQKQVEASRTEIKVQTGKQQAIIEEQNKRIELLLHEMKLVREQLDKVLAASK